MVEIPIKVFNWNKKRDSKTYMLSLQVDIINTIMCLRKEILNQLSKSAVKFDLAFNVGYFSGSHKYFTLKTQHEGRTRPNKILTLV